MGGCDLRIAFANGKREYLVGEFVEGDVSVVTDGDCKCDGLKIEFGWRTSGKCEPEERAASPPVNAFQGPWSAGKSYRYPFRFQVPDTAPTYAGRNGSVEWSVTAAADVPWARDPKTEERVVVRRAQKPRAERPAPPAELFDGGGKGPDGCTRGFLLVFCTVFSVLVMVGGFHLVRYGLGAFGTQTPDADPPGVGGGVAAILGGAVVMLLPFVFAVLLLRASAFRKKLGGVRMTVTPGVARAGESIRVGLQVSAKKPVELREIVGFLRSRETAIELQAVSSNSSSKSSFSSSTGRRPVSHVHDEEKARFEMSGPITLVPGTPRSFEATVRIPDGASPNFKLTYLAVDWLVEFRFKASATVDASTRLPFKIVE